MRLTNVQIKQIELQRLHHQHDKYEIDIILTEGFVLKNFVVLPGVLRPEIVTAIFLARWLFFNNGLYIEKKVLDMGSGSGIQGITMGLNGAQKIFFTDISSAATENTKKNVSLYSLQDKSEIISSNLFEKINDKFDLIVFNHPFFIDSSPGEFHGKCDLAMLDRGKLIHDFFGQARNHLVEDGSIIMPYFHLAGDINDPGIQALKHGYKIKKRFNMNVTTGIQKGPISIYEIF